MELAARTATQDDLDVVTALCELAVDELRPHRGGDIWSRWEGRQPPYDTSVQSSHDDDATELLVGTIDEVAVAYASVTLVALHDGEIVANITDLYVMPDARGVGLGETMMAHITDWAQRNDAKGLDSIALPGDRATKNFFETFGMVARALRVHRRI